MIKKSILIVAALTLSACSDHSQKGEFMKGCTSQGGSKSACSCIFTAIEENFTKEELDAMDRNQLIPKKFNEVVLKASTSCIRN